MDFTLGVALAAWVMEFGFFFMLGYFVFYAVDTKREQANLALQKVASTLDHWKMDEAADIVRHIVAHDWDNAAGLAVNLARELADPSRAMAKEAEILSEFYAMHAGTRDGQELIKKLLKDSPIPGVTLAEVVSKAAAVGATVVKDVATVAALAL